MNKSDLITVGIFALAGLFVRWGVKNIPSFTQLHP